MRILGIDPGSRVVGFGCIETRAAHVERAHRADPGGLPIANQVDLSAGGRGAVHLVEAGVVEAGTSADALPARLRRIGDGIDGLLRRLSPHVLVLEEAFFGKSVQAALRMGEARGVVILCAARAGVAIHQYPPATIKQAVAGAGSAGKEQVARMAALLLGSRTAVWPLDASDALAAALCHHFRATMPVFGAPGSSDGAPARA